MNTRRPSQPRDIFQLLWRRARGGNHGRLSSFDESLLRGQRSDGTWCDLDSEVVPKGYVPVYVGSDEKRFIVPMLYLSMPDFRELMEMAAEEFGYEQEGGLKIPCEEEDFEEILYKCLAKCKAKSLTWKK